MPLDFATPTETASSLRARAERCRALSRVAYLPFAAQMLMRLAEQLEGEAARLAPRPPMGSGGSGGAQSQIIAAA